MLYYVLLEQFLLHFIHEIHPESALLLAPG